MRLFEMKRLPEQAGLALLDFDPKADGPRRKDATITIPLSPLTEFFPLKNGEQFLLGWLDPGGQRFFFGGTDERPFLVELQLDPFVCFGEDGEEAFYGALKPDVISELELAWAPGAAKRQGDIFAYRLPMSWDELIWQNLREDGRSMKLTRSRGMRVFETRHVLKGVWTECRVYRDGKPVVDFIPVVDGELEAPDHRPLELRGPHAIAQAKHLYRPQQAD